MAARRTFGGRVTPAQWERLKPLFDEAADLPSAERAEFLDHLRAEGGDGAKLAGELARLLDREADAETDEAVAREAPLFRLGNLLPSEQHFFSDGETVIGRFRIVRFLGRGGMGEVYQAEDTHLAADVALKTLRPDVALDPDSMRRFRQEVQMARRVTSTNVCRIHDLFQVPGCDGRRPSSLLSMELLSGVTLADRIERDGPLPFAEAERIALQLCAALQAIHDAGVIHRDFKSRNIMLVERGGATQAVVMDLGLARESKASGADDSGITMTGAVMGTPECMAPEQFEGQTVTPMADIYALGVVLYELATGIRPFHAATPLAAAVLRAKRPAAASEVRAGVPRQWDHVIERCLEYEPEKRWASAKEVAEALSAPPGRFRVLRLGTRHTSPAVRPVSKKIGASALWIRRAAFAAAGLLVLAAVLWLASARLDDLLHPLPAKRFVALMAWPADSPAAMKTLLDSILVTVDHRLAREEVSSKDLLLISSADAEGQTPLKKPSDAVDLLGANLVLAASLRPSGSGVVLSLNVLEAATGKSLRRRTISSSKSGLRFLAENAAIAAAQLLSVALNRSREEDHDQMANLSAPAFELFNSAEDLAGQPNDAGLEQAIEKYEKTLELAPTFSPGYARLSMAFIRRFRKSQDPAVLRLAGRNAGLALRYDPGLAEAVLAKAAFNLYSGDTAGAMEEFRRALQIDPANPEILFYKAQAFRDLDRPQDEESAYREIIHQRPNFWPAYNDLGSLLFRQGRYEEAVSILGEGAAVAPRVATLLTNLGTIYLLLHKTSEAAATFQKSLEIAPNEISLLNLGSIAFEAGDYQKALAYYSKARDLKPASSLVWRNIADCYTMLGEDSQARENYAKAAEVLSATLRTNPRRGSNWMNLAYYEAKLGHREQAEADLAEAERRGASDLESQFVQAQALAVLGRKNDALRMVLNCLKHGLSVVEVQLAVDLKEVRASSEYRRLTSHTVTAPPI